MRYAYSQQDGIHVILTPAEFHSIYRHLLGDPSDDGLLSEMEDVASLLALDQLDNEEEG